MTPVAKTLYVSHSVWFYLPTVNTNWPRLEQTRSNLVPSVVKNQILYGHHKIVGDKHFIHPKGKFDLRCVFVCLLIHSCDFRVSERTEELKNWRWRLRCWSTHTHTHTHTHKHTDTQTRTQCSISSMAMPLTWFPVFRAFDFLTPLIVLVPTMSTIHVPP